MLVKANSVPLGPGPCLYSDSPDNVWVDGFGFLHLRITNSNGNWSCAEIYSQRVFRHGLYAFKVGSQISTLDPNVDLGLFTWDDTDASFSNREIDIEASRFGNPIDPTNAQFVVQPFNAPEHLMRFTIQNDSTSLQSFEWRGDHVLFSSFDSEGQILKQWFDTAGVPPAGTTNARMNLWIYNGLPPSSETEAIVEGFSFTPTYPDFDADGKLDYAVWRPGSAFWYVIPTNVLL